MTSTGPLRLMVTEDSAHRIGLADNLYQHVPLSTNHRDLVRFDHASDPNYGHVKIRIKSLASKAPEVVHGRFTCEEGS